MEEEDTTETTVFAEAGSGLMVSRWFDKLKPRPEIVFISQMLVIYVVIGVSLFNLTQGNGDAHDGKLWIALLSSCLGYMLPNPKVETSLKTP